MKQGHNLLYNILTSNQKILLAILCKHILNINYLLELNRVTLVCATPVSHQYSYNRLLMSLPSSMLSEQQPRVNLLKWMLTYHSSARRTHTFHHLSHFFLYCPPSQSLGLNLSLSCQQGLYCGAFELNFLCAEHCHISTAASLLFQFFTKLHLHSKVSSDFMSHISDLPIPYLALFCVSLP